VTTDGRSATPAFPFAFSPGMLLPASPTFRSIPSLVAVGFGKCAGHPGARLGGVLVGGTRFLLTVTVRGLAGRQEKNPVPVLEVEP